MVATQRHGDDRIDQRAERARQPCDGDGQKWVAGVQRRHKAEHSAHQHHAFDAEIDISGFLAQDAAKRAEQDRRAHLDGDL